MTRSPVAVQYHKGFREQVSKWPRNPLDDIIAWLRKRPQARVADLGCGEARLAASVPNKVGKMARGAKAPCHSPPPLYVRQMLMLLVLVCWQVHSFDLVARNSRVIACDIAKVRLQRRALCLCKHGLKWLVCRADWVQVPLPPSSVDVVVFCLSLMGTNMMDFITEAKRLLVDGGLIKVSPRSMVVRRLYVRCLIGRGAGWWQIAEVRSRFEGQEGGIDSFKKVSKMAGSFRATACAPWGAHSG